MSLRRYAIDLSAPVLFLARGHSGTSALARVLESAGIYMGDARDPASLNATYDSLPFTHDFQRTLVPKLFTYGQGCRVDVAAVTAAGLPCLQRHLKSYHCGPWGFKTCAGMFSHPLYRTLFPRARYIHLVRDGRDVVLSGEGLFHLTNPQSRAKDWEYFKIITFGLTNDIEACPFALPEQPAPDDDVMRNRYWIQARSWCEHVRMMKHLERSGDLAPQVHTIQYEALCRQPRRELEGLFAFLEVPLPEGVRDRAEEFFHTSSIGRFRRHEQYTGPTQEDLEAIFASMAPDLRAMGYPSEGEPAVPEAEYSVATEGKVRGMRMVHG